jgi:hypothetical protein
VEERGTAVSVQRGESTTRPYDRHGIQHPEKERKLAADGWRALGQCSSYDIVE